MVALLVEHGTLSHEIMVFCWSIGETTMRSSMVATL